METSSHLLEINSAFREVVNSEFYDEGAIFTDLEAASSVLKEGTDNSAFYRKNDSVFAVETDPTLSYDNRYSTKADSSVPVSPVDFYTNDLLLSPLNEQTALVPTSPVLTTMALYTTGRDSKYSDRSELKVY